MIEIPGVDLMYESVSMEKGRFLLIYGSNYYPAEGITDWGGFYDSPEEAEAALKLVLDNPAKYIDIDWARIVELTDE